MYYRVKPRRVGLDDLLRVITEVEVRNRVSFTDMLSVVGTIASLAALVVSVAR